ncbi:sodium-dependent bicarbonate transport family permease [Exiguobacterium sp. SH3S2]|uniref:sodium-dependent bicarbonate transport family permease n=1 Tax=unclassified Exiguobacterium TaxID=2644629 RepID=UPI001038DF82|nr:MULTISPECIES: sodium-dependent bicarbonate transport family permease [unclassified Exiguobacterium]TCI26100.1 sodium-dependent bicarbonate transport family permease [Exiguobacterium sp. SH5S4]TCI44822.1 sodium-dependent bicarbonate transport family permease [Exiguobacterium sp. SH3S3]TCI53973.1 sodium-dependent bicarbonate transport family permease [Exiguobacterium sp. SH5S13]TCI60243.1 sodium-dependent bicarbonate transport family permease [Exiguobacterium sp. SH3S2]TCI64295.1 sodium-depen
MELLTFLLTSAPVLLFVTGVIAALGKSNLRIPESLSVTLNIYLLLAIGLKGGMGLAAVSLDELAAPLAVTLVLGMVLPLVAFGLGRLLKFSFHERIAMAATFGSVSLVTYVAATAQLERLGISYEPFMTTLVVVLEIPGLVVALLLYNQTRVLGITAAPSQSFTVIRDSMLSKSILLLIAGLVVGFVTPDTSALTPFFVDLFPGVLLLFLLSLGVKVGHQLKDVPAYGMKFLIVGTMFPLIGAIVGYFAAGLAGLSDGGTILLMTLAASGSYIAAPAMLQASVPEAEPSFYLTLALAVTFPFNLLVGIPLFITIVT